MPPLATITISSSSHHGRTTMAAPQPSSSSPFTCSSYTTPSPSPSFLSSTMKQPWKPTTSTATPLFSWPSATTTTRPPLLLLMTVTTMRNPASTVPPSPSRTSHKEAITKLLLLFSKEPPPWIIFLHPKQNTSHHHKLLSPWPKAPQPSPWKQRRQRETEPTTPSTSQNFNLRFRCARTSVHSEVSTVGTLAVSTTKPIFRIVVPSPSTAAAAAFGSSFRSTPATEGKTEDTATILAVRRAKPYLQFRIWVILFDDPDNHRRPSAELSGQTVDSLGKRTAPLSFWPRKDEGTTFLCVSGDSSSVNPVSRNFLWRLFADKFQKLDFRTMNGSTLHRSYTMGGIEPTYANKDVIGSELHLSMEIG